MNITVNTSAIKTIQSSDPRFLIKDKYVIAPRAGFEISINCPDSYKSVIIQCINKGWLQPVAHMTERELLFVGLNESN